MPLDARHLVGAVSTIFWGLMLVVTLKYVMLILRADNRGEGGIMALTALAVAGRAAARRGGATLLLLLGVFGAALFYGDSVITPAISVLGAVEGLEVVAPALQAPTSCRSRSACWSACSSSSATARGAVGKRVRADHRASGSRLLAVTGVLADRRRRRRSCGAQSAATRSTSCVERGWHVFAALGAIVLALTGAEALYADMGHFGKTPIRLAWLGLVLPALALNYMGQGALLMRDPAAHREPVLPPVPGGLADARWWCWRRWPR